MNNNQSTPASAVAALQQEIRTRTEVIRTLADFREQLDADRICGSWLSTENNLSASVRRIGEGTWRILVFDHALCYKRIVQDGIIALRRHRLWLGADDGNRVIYDAAADYLSGLPQEYSYFNKEYIQSRRNGNDYQTGSI